jgi:hypothetical protein
MWFIGYRVWLYPLDFIHIRFFRWLFMMEPMMFSRSLSNRSRIRSLRKRFTRVARSLPLDFIHIRFFRWLFFMMSNRSLSDRSRIWSLWKWFTRVSMSLPLDFIHIRFFNWLFWMMWFFLMKSSFFHFLFNLIFFSI